LTPHDRRLPKQVGIQPAQACDSPLPAAARNRLSAFPRFGRWRAT
jgi:hypothetical protein